MTISATNNTNTVSVTEFSLTNNSTVIASQTADVIMQAFVDVSAMAAGDQYQFTIYEKINGGAQKVIYQSILTGAQPSAWVAPSLILMDGWDVTIKKLAGTDRSFSWSIRKVS